MQSIVSYQDRGIGGNSHYRGNCSPRLIEDLIDFYKVKNISDYMCGSGTTKDVAEIWMFRKEMNLFFGIRPIIT